MLISIVKDYVTIHLQLDRCVESCNTLNDISKGVCFGNETEDVNLSVFNMVTGINESKRFAKHILCKCECKFNDWKCNSNQKWNNDKCRCECKSSKEHKYLTSIFTEQSLRAIKLQKQ